MIKILDGNFNAKITEPSQPAKQNFLPIAVDIEIIRVYRDYYVDIEIRA